MLILIGFGKSMQLSHMHILKVGINRCINCNANIEIFALYWFSAQSNSWSVVGLGRPLPSCYWNLQQSLILGSIFESLHCFNPYKERCSDFHNLPLSIHDTTSFKLWQLFVMSSNPATRHFFSSFQPSVWGLPGKNCHVR